VRHVLCVLYYIRIAQSLESREYLTGSKLIEVEEEEQKSLVEYLDMNLLSYITS